MTDMEDVMTAKAKTDKYIMPTYGRHGFTLNEGSGTVCSGEGREVIDFGSGIGVNSLGFCDEQWVEAVCAQAHSVQHTSNLYYNDVSARFAAKLCRLTGYSKLFYGNSGAEANECAIKIARKYSFDKYGPNRYSIVTMLNSFHGRTLATLSATGQDDFHVPDFYPYVQGFMHAHPNDLDLILSGLRYRLKDRVAAVMIEFVQGEGGVISLSKDYVKGIAQYCEDNDILLIADEVQTGVGRTGKFLAAEHYDVKPDITTLAKGLGGGLPIGVCLSNEKCMNVLGVGGHGSTFGGNPIVCAGGLSVIDTVSRKTFLNEVRRKGLYIKSKLSGVQKIRNVTGMGLMMGIALKDNNAEVVRETAMKNGLLVLQAKNKIRLLPPLNITYQEIDKGCDILINAINRPEREDN
jgi:acetylornithine/N-succinyldiaminopimelate aminotransferase